MLDKWMINSLGATKLCQDELLLQTRIVKQGFSTRLGGTSEGEFSSLNLALHVGDNEKLINNNRELFSDALGVKKENWVTLNQIHSDQIFVIGEKDIGKGSASMATVVGDGDAMITKEPGIPLVTFYADCISLYIVDSKQKAIGLAHAGWKGTVQEIGLKTLMLMGEKFGTSPADCKVSIGPGIDQCCYEVDRLVYEMITNKNYLWEKAATSGKSKDKWQLNLKLINWQQFISCGVKKENISVSSMCTRCNQHLFFSYRGTGGNTGRMGALLMLI